LRAKTPLEGVANESFGATMMESREERPRIHISSSGLERVRSGPEQILKKVRFKVLYRRKLLQGI